MEDKPRAVLADQFFATARVRYLMMERRAAGQPAPWTEDPIFAAWRFCNVHREHDRTTAWFRENVRSKLHGLHVVKATVAFRWFNRVETGELIKDLLLKKWNSETAHSRLYNVEPVVTGAYIINGEPGYTKLNGVLNCIDRALPMLDEMWPEMRGRSLETVWGHLRTIPYLGPFMAYEVVSDLRWTDAVNPTDRMTWAVPGPGCTRGLSRVATGNVDTFTRSQRGMTEMSELMAWLLEESKNEWPSEWTPWEMREVEHWACEFDKYQRAKEGSRLKRRYP